MSKEACGGFNTEEQEHKIQNAIDTQCTKV